MSLYAKVSSSALVVDVISPIQFEDSLSFWVDVSDKTPAVMVGATYNPETQEFTNPEIVVIPPPPVPTSFGHVITQLAFRNRFTPAESVGIELASIHDQSKAINDPANVNAAGLRNASKKLDAASYVQLDRADLLSDLMAFEAFGLLAAGRANAIISGVVGSVELPAFIRANFSLPEIPSDYERGLNGGKGFLSPQEII